MIKTRTAAILAALIALAAPASGQTPTTCTPAGAGKYCETRFRDIMSTLGTDAAGQPISLTVAGKRDTPANTTDALAYVGSMMMMLEPASTQEGRAAVMSRLIAGAGGPGGRGHARFGAYDLTLRFEGADLTFYVDRRK
jgi:hypothetical protein